MATSTIVVNFGSGTSADTDFVKVELDDILNVDSAGETISSFSPGDSVYFLVQHGDTVKVGDVKSTSGSISLQSSSVSREREQQLFFTTGLDTDTLEYDYIGTYTDVWKGNTAQTTVAVGGRTITPNGGTYPAISDSIINAEFISYKLTSDVPTLAEDEDYPVGIVVYIEAV